MHLILMLFNISLSKLSPRSKTKSFMHSSILVSLNSKAMWQLKLNKTYHISQAQVIKGPSLGSNKSLWPPLAGQETVQ